MRKPIASIPIILATIILLVIIALPTPDSLPVAGQRMLGILVFAIIVWVTEAFSYEASAITITALIAILIGLAPSIENPDVMIGTSKAMSMALSGFANSALALVAGALFLAAAMTYTGLDKRIALYTLNKIGTSARRIYLGAIIVTIILSLLVPSATARSAAVVPIMMGIIAAFNINKNSNFAAGLMIIVAQATSVWNVGIQTAAAQNLLTLGFMERMLNEKVSWGDWLLAGAPWSILMSFVVVFVVYKMLPPDTSALADGKEAVQKSLQELGPMTTAQKKLLSLSIILLILWATGGKFHPFDTTTITYAGLVYLLLPNWGVMPWSEIQKRIPWGTIIVFGVGISLGTTLLTTQAGQWLAGQVILYTGLDQLGPFAVFASLALFLIVIHLGFASATALTSAMMPILIALLIGLDNGVNTVGMSMLLGFVMSYGFILPINAPQNMVCLGTNTFTARQFAKTGIVITILGYALMLLFSLTYWDWLGWM